MGYILPDNLRIPNAESDMTFSMQSAWRHLNPDTKAVDSLSAATGVSPFLARLLVNRGIRTPEAAHKFLQPSLKDLRFPFHLKDSRPAVRRIYQALENRENILIFSDYDADGITSAALLYQFLTDIGARASIYIPHRIDEGYGLQDVQILNGAVDPSVDLIITADCGISSVAAVDAATKAGIDVVVTDHHNVPDRIPQATAVVNPKQPDCPSGLDHMAGVGIAFMLIVCLRAYLREKGFWQRQKEPNLKAYCDLVAIGTLADGVPLVAENRILSACGIQLMQSGVNRPGVEALLQTANTAPQHLTSEDLLYRVVPRINAAGRMDDASIAVEALTTDSRRHARALVGQLDDLNRQRKETEDRIITEIKQVLASNPEMLDSPSLVLDHSDWHEGVLGIVASRMVDAYQRPVILLSNRDGIRKGSARSTPQVDLYHCLSQCAGYLEAFGGHSQAAGLRLHGQNLPAFKARFDETVAAFATSLAPTSGPVIDAELPLDVLTDDRVAAVEALMPFGNNNPEPVFTAYEVEVVHSDVVGKHHMRMQLRQKDMPSRPPVQAIQFNVDPLKPPPERFAAVAFHLRWNRWAGKKTVQMIIVGTQHS